MAAEQLEPIDLPEGVLLAATPIGNRADASPRLVAAIERADLIAAEDTRRLRRLAADLGARVSAPVMALHDHNEGGKAAEVVRRAANGDRVLVVSDAGMPTVSDPGFRLVEEAVAAQVPITVLPGPSAVLTALALSGLPTDRFCFEGFLPRKPGRLARAAARLAREERTIVLFESPRRVAATLSELAEAMGPDRPAAVCRELTKIHEEVVRDTLSGLARWAGEREVLGEIVVVVGASAGAAPAIGLGDAAARVVAMADAGSRLRDAAREVAEETGHATRDLYQAALSARGRA